MTSLSLNVNKPYGVLTLQNTEADTCENITSPQRYLRAIIFGGNISNSFGLKYRDTNRQIPTEIPNRFCTHFIGIYVDFCLDVGQCEYTIIKTSRGVQLQSKTGDSTFYPGGEGGVGEVVKS